MEYPYITMIKKHNSQLIMEVCNEFSNYRIIIKKNSLFDDYEINSQKYQKTEGNKVISIFVGRMADAGKDPIPIIKESIKLTKKMKKVEILWASTREAYNYLQAKNYGCQIITMPPSIIKKISVFGKTHRELTLDTVKKFLMGCHLQLILIINFGLRKLKQFLQIIGFL